MRRPLFILLIVPFFFIACSPNNVTVDNSLKRYFDSAGVQGSFGFFDNGQGRFTICNLSRFSDSFYTPGETFDILMSLVAIQTGVVKDDQSSIGKVLDSIQSILKVEGPHTLGQCFRDTTSSGDLGFMELGTQELSRDTLKKWIDSLQYGNKNMGSKDTMSFFWEDNQLKINSDQQLGLLKKLYFNQLPFFQRTQQIVCRMMTAENDPGYRLSYKTARGIKEDGRAIGWVMGWAEVNKSPYFFVVNLESADPNKNLNEAGLTITKGILRQLGFSQGKK
ncbi:MAG TPA: penicillin-binding transpeptidase domain-containing protein [Puia sp.]|jgi:beta-lactamase class D|nr:penicillin-binding transpeptidase domain-containing protein [Puia sp.]